MPLVMLHQLGNQASQFVCLPTLRRLRVHTDGILSSTRPSEGTSLLVLHDQGVDLTLESGRLNQPTLSIGGNERSTVRDLNTNEAVGKIGISVEPFLGAPALVRKNDLDHEHIGKGIADSLVDELNESLQVVEVLLLSGRVRLAGVNVRDGAVGEDDGSVAVGLKVDSDIKLGSSVVEMLDTGGGALDGEPELLGNVCGGGAVGIGGLHNTDVEVDTSALSQVADKASGEGSNLVTIEKTEMAIDIVKVVDQAVGITVKRSVAGVVPDLSSRGKALVRLDEIGTTLKTG